MISKLMKYMRLLLKDQAKMILKACLTRCIVYCCEINSFDVFLYRASCLKIAKNSGKKKKNSTKKSKPLKDLVAETVL